MGRGKLAGGVCAERGPCFLIQATRSKEQYAHGPENGEYLNASIVCVRELGMGWTNETSCAKPPLTLNSRSAHEVRGEDQSGVTQQGERRRDAS